MNPPPKVPDAARRLPVWQALADLYLDTKLDALSLQQIAGVLAGSGYTWPEIQAINYDEVAPALWFNVQDIAGEWAGWDEKWLLERISSTYTGVPHRILGSRQLWRKQVDEYTASYLAEIASYMP